MFYSILFMLIVAGPYKEVEKNGMTFWWSVSGSMLHCRVQAPTEGWVAIGFNTCDRLAGTHLVMGAVVEDFYHIRDRHILAPGVHKSMLEISLKERSTTFCWPTVRRMTSATIPV